jgi:hypothetical protein
MTQWYPQTATKQWPAVAAGQLGWFQGRYHDIGCAAATATSARDNIVQSRQSVSFTAVRLHFLITIPLTESPLWPWLRTGGTTPLVRQSTTSALARPTAARATARVRTATRPPAIVMLSPRQSQVRKANDDHIQKYLTHVQRQEKWAPQRDGRLTCAPQRRVCAWHPRHATSEAVSTPAPTACLRGQYLRASTVAQHIAKRNRERYTALWWRELRSLAGALKINQAVEEFVRPHIASRVHSLGCPLTTSSMGVKAVQTALRGILLVALVAVVHGDEEDGHELGANEVCACVVFLSRPILTINCPVGHSVCGRRHTRCPSAVDW